MTTVMRFQGNVASMPVGDVAQNLSSNRKSGVLTLQMGTQIRRITFHDGKMVCYTDNLGFSITGWLKAKQVIPEVDLERAMKRYRRAKRKSLGEILRDADCMELEEYLELVRQLVGDTLCETFSFREGTFEFVEDAHDEDAYDREILDSGLEFGVNEVLMEAARRMDEWEGIHRCLPSEHDLYVVPEPDKKKAVAEFSQDEAALEAIEYLDGTRSIAEVIALISAGRFYACRAIAQLVSQKRARPVDGTQLVAQLEAAGDAKERARALAQLKAALEREPGNQLLLRKLADLCQREGKPESSAVYHKLLAQQLVEAGDLDGAERDLRISLKLNQKDISTWQKLYELLTRDGAPPEDLLEFGTTFARNLRQMGLNELARDHLQRMLVRFPQSLPLRFEYADTLFALGDRVGAVEHLLALAREQVQRGEDRPAQSTLERALAYDNQHSKARELFEQLESGALEERRRRRQMLLRAGAAVLLVGSIGFFLGYDFFVRRQFALALREVFADGLIEKGDYAEVESRIEAVRDRYPVSLLRLLEVRECLAGLREWTGEAAVPPGAVPPASDDPRALPAHSGSKR